MVSLKKSFHQFENKLDRSVERFSFHHPIVASLGLFIGMPIFILLSVSFLTTIIAFPMAWIFGWL